jgi:hypothetical protein
VPGRTFLCAASQHGLDVCRERPGGADGGSPAPRRTLQRRSPTPQPPSPAARHKGAWHLTGPREQNPPSAFSRSRSPPQILFARSPPRGRASMEIVHPPPRFTSPMPAGSADGLITHYMTYLFDAGGERRWAAPRREEERRVLAALDAAVDRVAERNLRRVHARPYATTHGRENERSHPPEPRKRAPHAAPATPTRRGWCGGGERFLRRSHQCTRTHTHTHTHNDRSSRPNFGAPMRSALVTL